MTSFTFTSEDLERINQNKEPNDKIFNEIENPRIAKGLMQQDGKTPDWEGRVQEQFIRDATRTLPVILKDKDKAQVILNIDNTGNDKERAILLLEERVNSLRNKGLSPEQVNDFKFMSNQANIGATSALLIEYMSQKELFNPLYNQYSHSTLAQLEIRQLPPDNQERLIYRTGSKMTFDKSTLKYNYTHYSVSAFYDTPSNDNILIIAEVDLGKLGATNYTPKVTCSIHAEGKNAEKILGQLRDDIPSPSNSAVKSSKEIKAQYQDIVVKTLQQTGYEELFKTEVKDNIKQILSNSYVGPPAALNALKEFNSTPQLFVDVLVDRISEINKIEDHKQREEEIKQLSGNSQVFFDHHPNTSDLVEKLSSSMQPTHKAQPDTVKSSCTAVVKETLDDLYRKSNIATLLNPKPDMLYSIDVEALRQHESTPKLFAEVLVDRISKVNNTKDPTKRAQKIKQLSDNAAHFVDQPKGYMKILVNDTVKEMAKEQNINLPKEGLISKISNNIKLMLAKMNVKIHGKSSELKEQKQFIDVARTRDKSGMRR